MKNYIQKTIDILPLIAFATSVYLSLTMLHTNPEAASAWSCSAIWSCLCYFKR